jgi:uncharacterized integral membrane protein
MSVLAVLGKEPVRVKLLGVRIDVRVVVEVIDVQINDGIFHQALSSMRDQILPELARHIMHTRVQPQRLFDAPLQVLHLLQVVVGGLLADVAQHLAHLLHDLLLDKLD